MAEAPDLTPVGPCPVQLMFYAPRVPGNTGSTMRLAAITGARFHVVNPLFRMDDASLRRAGLDYRDRANVVVHPDFDAALAAIDDARFFAFTAHATSPHTAVEYRAGDVLLFGPEDAGLPDDVLAHPRVTGLVRIPMLPGNRSLNLAQSAAIGIYEAWRQFGFSAG